MGVYIFVNIFIILLAILFFCVAKKSSEVNINNNHNDIRSKLFASISFFMLLIISGFRGDFTSDYKSYSDLFSYVNTFSFREIFEMNFFMEKGYIMLNKIIGIFSENSIYLMVTISFIILILFFREFRRESSYVWFSVLLFINIGSYYTSFNITRQILATAIVFAGSKFLYERKFIKYLIIVVIAALFHKTALIMIPFYFILQNKFRGKTIFFVFLALLILTIYIDRFMDLIQRYFYIGYTYGIVGRNITNVVVPLAIFIFVLFYLNLVDLNKNRNNILVNAVLFYVFFSILGLRVQILQRFAEFFSPYALILIPNIVSQIKDKYLKKGYVIIIIIFFLVMYNYVTLSGTGYDPFYFIWK